MKYTLLSQVKHPSKAITTDAGIDFFLPDNFNDGEIFKLNPHESLNIPLGVRVEVPRGYALVMMNKSGICTKNKLTVGACVIDCGYEGEVHAHMINYSNEVQELRPGTKIVQGLLLPIYVMELECVESFENTSERGAGGFGSTGV